MENKHLSQIDVLKGVGILLIVIVHFNSPNIFYPEYDIFRKIILSFAMPLFMMASGYLHAYTSKIGSLSDYAKLIRKKAMRLGLPYLSVSLFIIVVKYFAGKFISIDHPLQPDFLWHLIFNPIDGYAAFLWYIYTLFIIFLIFPVLEYICRNILYLTIAVIALYFIKITDYFCLNRAFEYLIYFYMGILLQRQVIRLKEDRAVPYFFGMLGLFLICFSASFLPERFYLIRQVFKMATAVTGSVGCFYLAFIINRYRRLLAFYALLGIYSAPIYLFHTASMAPVKYILGNLMQVNLIYFLLCGGVVVSFGIIVPIALTKYVFNRSRKMSLLFLGVGSVN